MTENEMIEKIVELLIRQRVDVLFDLRFPEYFKLTEEFEKLADKKVFEFINTLETYYPSKSTSETSYIRYADLREGYNFPKIRLLINLDIEIFSIIDSQERYFLNAIWKNTLGMEIANNSLEYFLNKLLRVETHCMSYEIRYFINEIFSNNKFNGYLRPKCSEVINANTDFNRFFLRDSFFF